MEGLSRIKANILSMPHTRGPYLIVWRQPSFLGGNQCSRQFTE
jgi:hypothetical protein